MARSARQYIFLLVAAFFFAACSSMKLTRSFKSDSFDTVNNKKILVVSRTPQDDIRRAYEKEITKKLRAKGLNATASHVVFPDLKPLTNKTVERITNTISMFREAGFQILLLTSLKDVEEQEILRRREGYGSMLDYYGNEYVTLKGYYDDLNAPPKLPPLGTELEPTTKRTVTFVLEAVFENLLQS